LALGYVTTTPQLDLLPAVVSRRSKATEHS
jgi:hypothetical protein